MSVKYSGSITLVSVADGEAGDSALYTIYSSHETVNKYYNKNTSVCSYSPEKITFWVTKTENNTETRLVPGVDYDTDMTAVGYTETDDLKSFWSLFNSVTGVNTINSGTSITAQPLLSKFRTINSTSVTIDLSVLFDYVVSVSADNTQAEVDAVNTIKSLLQDAEGGAALLFRIFKHSGSIPPPMGDLLCTKTIIVQVGIDSDIAKFTTTATNIQMAVENQKMVFDANGLTIKNGGIEIQGKDDVTLLSYNEAQEELYISGNGRFTGVITATSGSFTGDVTASHLQSQSGSIGGWTIQEDGLYSENNTVKLLSTGNIYADSIDIGTSAHITDYIKLGEDSYLYNPDGENGNGNILKAGEVWLKENGLLKIGDIYLDGASSIIRGANFEITPDTCTFKDINATGKISTAVFETNHVQAVGGAMIFKPSYKVSSHVGNKIYLDYEVGSDMQDQVTPEVGDYVHIIKSNGRFIDILPQIISVDDNTILISASVDDYLAEDEYIISVVDLGKSGDFVIGINSNNGSKDYLRPRGLTMSDFVIDGIQLQAAVGKDSEGAVTEYGDLLDSNSDLLKVGGVWDTTGNPQVFIGDLDTAGIDFGAMTFIGERGYGLFAENVFLTGCLTTKGITSGESTTFAGINTRSSVAATVFPTSFSDTSNIIFWGGTADVTTEGIQNAKFQVTEKGSVYAEQGLFNGVVISKSKLEGADIYGARIHGWDVDGDIPKSLNFYDAANGLVFNSGDPDISSSDVKEVFTIGTNGFRIGTDNDENYFIKINTNGNNHTVAFKGDKITIPEYYTDSSDVPFLHLYKNVIYGSNYDAGSVERYNNSIEFNSEGISFSNYLLQKVEEEGAIVEKTVKTEGLNIKNTGVYIENTMKVRNELILGNQVTNSSIMPLHYQAAFVTVGSDKQGVGYDLYVG